MSADAAVAVGNVVMSRPFLFAINQTASRTGIARVPWSPRMPGKRTLATNCWIYAIEVGEQEGDQFPILAAEFHADKDGNLGFVDGGKRRLIEATEKGAPVPASIPMAALPLARQGKRLRYRFVATRGRLGKAAIADMENGLDPIYEPQNLSQEDIWFHAVDDALYVDVVDPVTVALSLSEKYIRALNEALAFTTPDAAKTPGERKTTETRSRQYQLALMMKNTLLAPTGELTDPLSLDGSLAGGGAAVMKLVSDYEIKVSNLMGRRSACARDLRRFLESKIWDRAMFWYLGTPQARNAIGHFWTDASFRCLDRLSETPEGRDFLRDLVAQADTGLLAFLFPPEPDSPGEALYGEIFPIVRKTATAAIIAFAETAPAMVLYAKKDINVIEKVRVTLENMFMRTTVVAVKRAPRGAITHLFVKSELTITFHIEIDYKRTKADYEEWVENGKPHWPEETKHATWSEIWGRLFMGVEMVNLCNTFSASTEKYFRQTEEDPDEIKKRRLTAVMEAVGGCLDLTVALEDPVHAVAKRLDSVLQKGSSSAAVAADGVAEVAGAEAEHEVAGIFSKLTKPAMFKALGAISAVIDTVCYYREGNEALEKHETGLAAGRYTVAAGSGLIAVASIANAAGYMVSAGSAAVGLTAAASVLLLAGVVVVVVGFVVIAAFTVTPWQSFASHSSFGLKHGEPGHDSWSGGDFSTWTTDKKGLDRQMQVLTSMLCSFTVSGDHSDVQTVYITFGAVPPGAKLTVDYTIRYANGVSHRPAYTIDLTARHFRCGGDATSASALEYKPPHPGAERLEALLLRADRPESARDSTVVDAQAEICLSYGGRVSAPGEDVATGTIPIGGKMTYILYRNGVAYTNDYKALDVEKKEGAEEASKGKEARGEGAENSDEPKESKGE